MRVHSSRLARFVLLALAITISISTVPAVARSPYRISDATEGDPGDGVLKPASANGVALPVAPSSAPICTAPAATTGKDAPATVVRHIFQPQIHVPGLGFLSLVPAWQFLDGRWNDAP